MMKRGRRWRKKKKKGEAVGEGRGERDRERGFVTMYGSYIPILLFLVLCFRERRVDKHAHFFHIKAEARHFA